jgi:mono/diheme cytochrome c family protein
MSRALAAAWLCGASALFGCYHVAQLEALVLPRGAGAPSLYAERCSTCHGETGRGDGLGGRGLAPAPRDFTDAAWQRAATDERIRLVIRHGGAAAGLSPQMAAHADLSDAELDGLVAHIRSLRPSRAIKPDRRPADPLAR